MNRKIILLSCLLGCTLAFPFVPESSQKLVERDRSEELSGEFEGDIVLNQEQRMELNQKNGIRLTTRRWPDNIVVYTISGNYSDDQKAYIKKALDTLELISCLKFKVRTNEADYVDVVNGTGCSSYVGYQTGRQALTLAANTIEIGCFRLATIMHEFLHALGFQHMQSTFNRDDFVTVKFENIDPQNQHNFSKYNSSQVTDFGISYDYNSVMHYGTHGFSKNQEPTLVPHDPNAKIGQRVSLSRKDIEKLNRMYECPI